MHQVEEVLPSTSENVNIPLLKSEIDDQSAPIPTIEPMSLNESSVAPAAANQSLLISTPIVSSSPIFTSTPSSMIMKRKRRVFRGFHSKRLNRLTSKPAMILARPQQPIVLTNSITPMIQPSIPSAATNTASSLTTYLVVDGNQGQLVQVTNDGQNPVTFRNQTGQILQATPITVVSTANQPSAPSLLSNSSQTITTVRTSSSIDMQQQTTLTSDTTTTTTQQLTGIIHQPSIISSNTSNTNLSLSIAQIADKVNHRHRRLSSSSLSRKRRGRPRLYERDPRTNKPIKSDITPTTNPTVFIPGQTNICPSLIFPQKPLPVPNPSLLQQHQYTYPSLLNGMSSTTSLLSSPSISSICSTNHHESSSTLNSSPVKSTNTDVAVHYLGGFVIREKTPSYSLNNNHKEQYQCSICETVDLANKFFDKENKFCSKLCSLRSIENKEPVRLIENNMPHLTTIKMDVDESVPLLPDHGLPTDPNRWTVGQVGEFIKRLTNDTIREIFHESEIDGQALLLMTPEHLRDTMKIKLGPSLVISSEINKLRERTKVPGS